MRASDWRRATRLRYLLVLFHIAAVLLFIPGIVFGQEILTAENYFDEVSARYGKIQDYTANISITQGETVMQGKLYYKNPNLLRIDFTEPADQVLVTNGEELTVYIPKYEVILVQKLRRRSQAALANMASEQGLNLLKKNYGVAYLSGPDWVPLEEGSDEMVRKLKLESRSTAEGFRQIVLAVGKTGLIRRITGVTIGYEEFVLDLTDVVVNQNIPDTRFEYDSPAYANVYNDFLFEAEE
jgi:outer membrane lipoprotein-sorting protein